MSMACATKKRGRWCVDFYDQHGRRRLKTLPKGATKREATKELRRIEKEVSNGVFLPSKKMPIFSEIADLWLENKKRDVREHTFDAYECHVRNNLKPYFGPMKISDIRFETVEGFMAKESTRGASTAHMKKSMVLLGGIMKYAIRKRLIDFNPLDVVDKPKGRSRYKTSDEMDIYKPDEIRCFLDNVDGEKYKTFFLLAVMSGARQGELIGLQWQDVDWHNSQIYIRRTYQRGKFFEPKSATSRRRIDLGPTVIKSLKKWKLACPPTELDLVFPSDAGTPLDHYNLVRRHYEPALRRAGLRRIKFHGLRHSYASMLIEAGEHPKYIQNQMGHSSINVTMDTYGHLMKSANRDSAAKLERMVFETQDRDHFFYSGDKMETKKKSGLEGVKVTV
jgi:integrase